MKKFVKTKKLVVSTESIRDLSNDQMTQVGGGVSEAPFICSMKTWAIQCTKGGSATN